MEDYLKIWIVFILKLVDFRLAFKHSRANISTAGIQIFKVFGNDQYI